MNKQSQKILLVNDMPGYGKVALAAASPILSRMGYETFSLPTAIISNTLNYGKHSLIDTTQYMKDTLKVWEELGFNYNAISTGFIVSEEQTELLINLCKEQSERDVVIFTDPIMGDGGKLYNSITSSRVDMMRKLISVADYIMPNYTEAAFLAETEYKAEGATVDELYAIIDKLRAFGAKSVMITSAIVHAGGESDDLETVYKAVVGYDHRKEEYFVLEYEEILAGIPGTGDIFSAVLVGHVMEGVELQTAVTAAMHAVSTLIKINQDNVGRKQWIPIEKCLDLI